MKKLNLRDLQVKSFVTSLEGDSSNTVKGGTNSGNQIVCDTVSYDPVVCTNTGGTGGGGTGAACNHTKVPFCPVSYPQIYCDQGSSFC